MIIDERKTLILQYNYEKSEWEDITKRVQWFEEQNNACRIKYVGNNTFYWKSWRDLKILDNPKSLDLTGKILYCDKVPMYGLSQVLLFETYVKLFYATKFTKLVKKSDIKIVSDITESREIKNLIEYLKEIAVLMPTEDGHNFLLNQLDKLTVLEDSVLGKFLQGKLGKTKDNKVIIYPFDTNASQRIAIKRAIEEDLSIIQGPPGTGKTETIRNIVANYVARGGAVAVVSGNNEATRNVKDKFELTGFGYLNAFLGNAKNIEAFFKDEQIPIEIIEKANKSNSARRLMETNNGVDTYLQYSLDVAKAVQLINEYEVEKEINDAEYQIKERKVPKVLLNKKYTSVKLLELVSVLESLPEEKITGFFNRARFLFRFGIIKLKEIAQYKEDSIEYLKNKYYGVKISELDKEKKAKQNFIDSNKLVDLIGEQKELSLSIFKACLQERYNGLNDRIFSVKDYRFNFDAFTKRYPIIYSTTHAIRSCSGENYLYDCVIIDESSQVDLISAVIAFSVAKKVVLVGDEKQLPHVVKSQLLPILTSIFSRYKLDSCFNYAKNSILSCVLKKEKNIVSTLLNEHYRCDPQIIGFCNKRFYNGELVVRTPHNIGNGVTIISHGSHFERNRANERQVDIIEKEIIEKLPTSQTGIIAPYNNQIELLNSRFGNLGYVIDTIHKFQGKEKDYIIMSTVANKIKFYEDEEQIDFLNNPNLINVAISRAKKRLYILASEEVLSQEGSILRDLSKYYECYCNETKVLKTNVFSVFDLMYDDYAPILEKTKKELLNISNFSSENIIATVIDEICKSGEYGALGYKFNYPLKYVIKINTLTDLEDIKFVSNINTHCDFVIYNKLNKEIEMVVEVDGSQHKEECQAKRDRRKDRLLENAGIKILRLSTTTIECKEKIIEKLLTTRQD
ncbi:MAG: AAA family ATPase [Clostridia bacterium]|nr:AAA family ATPase [Clostridia bacterium]